MSFAEILLVLVSVFLIVFVSVMSTAAIHFHDYLHRVRHQKKEKD